MKKELIKEDRQYLGAMVLFMILCVMRFWDRKVMEHETVLYLMRSIRMAEAVTVLFYGSLFVLFSYVLKETVMKKRTMWYLLAFLSVFMVPFFLCDSYFGATDLYAWVITMGISLLLMKEKAVGLMVPSMFLLCYLSPVSSVTCGAVVLMLGLHQALLTEKKGRFFLVVLSALAGLVGVFACRYMNHFSWDVQGRISGKRFVAILVLLSPYIILGVAFLLHVIRGSRGKDRAGYVLFTAGGLPGFVLWAYAGDYCRSIFYGFVYYIFLTICFMTSNNNYFEEKVEQAKLKVRSYLVLAPVFFIYPLIILTFWMVAAHDFIDPETIIQLTQ